LVVYLILAIFMGFHPEFYNNLKAMKNIDKYLFN